jgi:MFS-type transporter involved in bile tolerance (Atg22 family)
MATVLSIQSQANSLFVALVAPLLGWSVDLIAARHPDLRFLPVAVLGIAVSATMLSTSRRSPRVGLPNTD